VILVKRLLSEISQISAKVFGFLLFMLCGIAPCTRVDIMCTSLQSIMNVMLSDDAWHQASLPVASVGIGMRKASDVSAGIHYVRSTFPKSGSSATTTRFHKSSGTDSGGFPGQSGRTSPACH